MKYLWRLIPLSFILLMSGCGMENLSALDPQGPVAEMQYSLIQLSLIIMVFVIIVVFAIYIFVLFKFREKEGDTHIPEQVHGNRALEIIWTTIPILLLLMLAIPNVIDTFTLADMEVNEEEDDFVRVEVTAHQFWWEFNYPDYDVTAGQDMYIPTDARILVELQASDVIHSFWVPALAGKQDNIPGIVNTLWFEAPQEGVYAGKCTELCGPSHWLMDFKVIAVDPDTFETWAEGMATPPEDSVEPEGEVLVQGRDIFEQSCISCHAVGDEGGATGPNLTNFGERTVVAGYLEYNEDNIKDWLVDTQAHKPGNLMPSEGAQDLSEEELDALTEYLMSLNILE